MAARRAVRGLPTRASHRHRITCAAPARNRALLAAVRVDDVSDGAWFKPLIDDRTDVDAARGCLAGNRRAAARGRLHRFFP